MTGPAHHTAARRALSNADGRSNGSPPMATSSAEPATTCVTGPASEMASVHGRVSGFLAWYEVNPAMNSSEIDASAPACRATTAWASSWISVNPATDPASHQPNSPPSLMNANSTMKMTNPAPTCTGKPSSRNSG